MNQGGAGRAQGLLHLELREALLADAVAQEGEVAVHLGDGWLHPGDDGDERWQSKRSGDFGEGAAAGGMMGLRYQQRRTARRADPLTIPLKLRQRLRAGRVIPFVGAGVSMAVQRSDASALFPSWHQLLLRGAERLEAEAKPIDATLVRALVEVQDADYLDAARRLRKELGPVWLDFLQEQINVKRAEANEDSLALARAVWGLGSRLIATTNYDRILEWACPGELRDDLGTWDIKATAEQARLLSEGAAQVPTVWHLHGRIRNAADLILTPGGYERLYAPEGDSEKSYLAALKTLRYLLVSHSFLFIGFSLDDEHFGVELRGVADIFEGFGGPHYALVREREADGLRRQGLPVELLTFEDFGAPLVELVEGLGRIAATSPEPSEEDLPAEKAAAEPADLTAYLEALFDQTDHIKISGISGGVAVKGAVRHPIEQLYTPLVSRGMPWEQAGETAPGEAFESPDNVTLAELLPRYPRLLIEGQPGAGKTTFLRFVAFMLAQDALGHPCPEGESWRKLYLGLEQSDLPPMPVLLRIADLLPLLGAEDAPKLRTDDRRWLLDLLEQMCRHNEYPVSRAAWQTMFENGSAILLLDGLDEVAEESVRERLFEVFRDACRQWKCPIVVTSRPIQTAALREMGFESATIEPFGDGEIRTFIDHWVAALHSAESAEDLRGEGERYRDDLLEAITERPRVRRLATNPVMLTCLCVVHWNEGRLPEGRSRVYRAVIRWLIASRRAQREEQGFTDWFAERALARLALAMVDSPEGKRVIFDLEEGAVAVDDLAEREFPDLAADERRHRMRHWLRFECLASGIVEEVAGNRVRFWHLTFEEFLAALQLSWRDDGEDRESDWWPIVKEHLDDAQWRETVELLPGCLLEGGEGRADRLLDRVLSLRGGDLASEARVAGIVGRLLEPLSGYHYRPRPEIATSYGEALERSLAIFTTEGASKVPVTDRIAAAEALGRGGDPRLRHDNFIEVPGLGGCRLGKYPLTVEEYQQFVEHLGYEGRRHWSDEGWSQKKKKGWEQPGNWEEQLAHPNRPVTEVSWYEAEAYCRWLSEQRGEQIRLPSEREWEKAATPASGMYPWGKAGPNEERTNFAKNVGAPTPVGVYPAGNGPYDHCDLGGVVWEWNQVKGVLRGGCWFSSYKYLRFNVHHMNLAEGRGNSVGFRALAVPAIPDS
ncbi:MAG: SUMF1/EgtB/PvdO family nonheme iron enzyme [bacterium]|nr:SUMF1/EgtB/PvdO family nonheme iron enzyme [bacterium]